RRHRALPSLQRPRASPPPALPHLRQNDVAPRRLLTPLRRLRAWRRSRLLSLQQPPAPRRQALLARQRPRASPPPALPHLCQNDVAPRRLLTPLRRLRAWRRSRLLPLQQPPAPKCCQQPSAAWAALLACPS